METLLIQCLRGSEIGQIKIEQINGDGLFYYSFKINDKNIIDFEKCEEVLFLQYNDEKECCGSAIGKFNSIIYEDGDKKIIKIEKIRSIKSVECKTVIDIVKEIKLELISNNVLDVNKLCNISVIQINQEKFEILNNLAETSNLIKEEENEFQNILRLYNKFEKSNKLDCEEGFSKTDVKKLEEIFKSYDKLERKEVLDGLAQRSIYARRVVNKGDRRANRTEFQRDWERIMHSKSFRRLEDKAQIYTLAKGDHFRTRLTHTLEVDQIARGIARELNLNEDLVQAIALGHDLGHTPFGHAGERTLNDILKKEGVKGGFKHNFQGVKVVNYLEEKYGEFEGIDLTYQVMEGILKHTKISDCKKCSKYNRENNICNHWDTKEALKCDENQYQIDNFLYKGDVEKLHPEYNFSTTLEGQVVAVADEIAQRAHDLDDGIASGIINERDFLEKMKTTPILKGLYNKINRSLNYIDKNKRDYIDVLDIKRARIVSDVITYFITEIVKKSKPCIKKYKQEKDDISIIRKNLISFEDDSKDKSNIERVRETLEEITSKKIISSEEVNCFDGKGEYIIRKLYKAYITNPRQMSKTTLTRIKREMSRYTNDEIDITEIYIENRRTEGKDIFDKDEIRRVKHQIFVRCIIDLISGMTDEFANKQFEKLYSPRTY